MRSQPQTTDFDGTAVTDSISEPEVLTCDGWILMRQSVESSSSQRVAVGGAVFLVGRNAQCQLSISDPTVSGRHAELVQVESGLFIRDLNSTNGTLLNGRKIQNLTGLRAGDVLHFGKVMYTLLKATPESPTATVTADASSDALAQLQFDKLLKRPALIPYFQPIVRLNDHSRIGYEVLSRSSLVGLETPAKMFRVAAQRTSETALSVVCRSEGLRVGQVLDPQMRFYVNTHPVELKSVELFDSLAQLRIENPVAGIVLEIHESAVPSIAFLRDLRGVLDSLSMELAYDDFGAGQARLKELFDVPPDVLKFDVQLIRGLPTASKQQRSTIQSLLRIVLDLNVIPLAEGVESAEEAACCCELGFELAQGFYFGRAEAASHWAAI